MAWWHQAFNNPTQRANYANAFSGGQLVQQIQVQNHMATQAGAGIASAIVGGAAKSMGECYNAGAQIGSAILSGLTQSLGASGQAIQRFGAQLLNTFTDALGSGIGGIAKLIGLAGKTIGAGIGAVSTVAGGVIGGAVSGGVGIYPGALIGASIGAAIAVALSSAAEAIGGIVGAVGKLAGAIGSTLVSALESVKTIVSDLVNTAGQFGRQVGGIHAAGNGALSYGQSGALAYQYGAFGVDPTGMVGGQNPTVHDMIARAYGFPSMNDPNSVLKSAMRNQQLQGQGLGGQYVAMYARQQLGMDDPQSKWMLNLPANKIQDQLSWQSKTQSAMGISPEAMQRWAEDLPLLQQRLSAFIEMVKVKFADLLSPMIFKGLEALTTYLSSHAQDIVDGIKSAVKWIYADLPVMLLGAGKSIAIGALSIVEGFRDMGHTFASFVRALGEGNKGWGDWVEEFLAGLDGLDAGINNFIPALAAVGQAFYNIASILSDIIQGVLKVLVVPMQWMANHVTAPLLKTMGLSGLSDMASAYGQAPMPSLDQLTGLHRIMPGAAYAANVHSDTDLAGAFHKLRGARDWGKDANAIDKWVDGQADGATSKLKDVLGYLDDKLQKAGSVEERRAVIDQLMAVNNKLDKINQGVNHLNSGKTDAHANILARAAAYVAEDAYISRH